MRERGNEGEEDAGRAVRSVVASRAVRCGLHGARTSVLQLPELQSVRFRDEVGTNGECLAKLDEGWAHVVRQREALLRPLALVLLQLTQPPCFEWPEGVIMCARTRARNQQPRPSQSRSTLAPTNARALTIDEQLGVEHAREAREGQQSVEHEELGGPL